MYTLYITNCRLVKIDNRKYIHDEDTSHTHKKKCLSVTNNMYCTHTHKHTQEREQIHKEAHLSYLKPMYEMAHVLSLDP